MWVSESRGPFLWKQPRVRGIEVLSPKPRCEQPSTCFTATFLHDPTTIFESVAIIKVNIIFGGGGLMFSLHKVVVLSYITDFCDHNFRAVSGQLEEEDRRQVLEV